MQCGGLNQRTAHPPLPFSLFLFHAEDQVGASGRYLSQTCCGDLTDSFLVLLLILALLSALSVLFFFIFLSCYIYFYWSVLSHYSIYPPAGVSWSYTFHRAEHPSCHLASTVHTWAYLSYIFPLPALIFAARFQVPRDWNLSYNCPLRPSITP